VNDQLKDEILNCNLCSPLGIDYKEARKQNLALAYDEYKPKIVKILWIVESPPKSNPPRYFYRPELSRFDSLFRETLKVLDIDIIKSKVSALKEFQGQGYFLIDSMKCPADKCNSHLKPEMRRNCRNILQEEILSLNPNKILIIKKDVYVPIIQLLAEIDLKYPGFQISSKVINKCVIPFPGSGQQIRFRELVRFHLDILKGLDYGNSH
jgi:hypothetical protein